MNIKLKVCGMREPNNINELVAIAPDYMGFIFYPKSPRYVGENFKEENLDTIPPHIKKIGVFVNEEIDKVTAVAKKFGLQGLQLHGNEPPEYCGSLKTAGFMVVKAFSIDETMDFKVLKPYESLVDYFLFDTKTSQYGGSGKTFDWSILNKYDNKKPFFLSGGIDLEHAEELGRLTSLNLHAIDINSRFELKPGSKDLQKIREFKERMGGV